MRNPIDQLLVHIYRASLYHHQAAIGSDRELRVTEVVTFFRKQRHALPMLAVGGTQDAGFSCRNAVFIEYMAYTFAETHITGTAVTHDGRECAVIIVPYTLYRGSFLLAFEIVEETIFRLGIIRILLVPVWAAFPLGITGEVHAIASLRQPDEVEIVGEYFYGRFRELDRDYLLRIMAVSCQHEGRGKCYGETVLHFRIIKCDRDICGPVRKVHIITQ